MLRAYIDDSVYEGQPPLFMLAGYISTAERWAALSNEWQVALDMEPRIRCFKVKQAIKRNGPFYECPPELCDERIAVFRKIVEKHVHAEFSIAFRIDDFKDVFKVLGKPFTNPYYFAHSVLMGELVNNQDQYKLPREPIDFIFDNRSIEKPKIMEGWDAMAKRAQAGDKELDEAMAFVRNPPNFQDDEEVLPLQAADMHATLVRLRLTEGLPEEKYLYGFSRRIRGAMLLPQKADLQRFVDGLLERYAPNEIKEAWKSLKTSEKKK